MNSFKNTELWKNSLAEQPNDCFSNQRTQLREAFLRFRDRANTMAGEIAPVLPHFTVHDQTHLDSLWQRAQLVAGNEYPLNPVEAFVFGGAILVHDLGMALVAYSKRAADLRQKPQWRDFVARELKQTLGRHPRNAEIDSPPEEISKQANEYVLRELHAEQAEELVQTHWDINGTQYYLIEDTELRIHLGPIIGKVARSHSLSVDQLSPYFQDRPQGAPGFLPQEWSIDAIKLACMLRATDASDISYARAPGFLSALRQPTGVSGDHWKFQQKLSHPTLDAGRLRYTSTTKFGIEDIGAWWTCFDTIRMIDSELRQIDALLSDLNKPRFVAKGVVNADQPERFSELVETQDWSPIDAHVKVGNISRLVEALGGFELYGRDYSVPLRELIQNGADAIRARRIIDNKPENWGSIVVRSGADEYGLWLEVEDDGIGMSRKVLTGPFLDFGTSFWSSPLMHQEFPGLESSSFESAGKFGIGFFSVFMWGRRVRVIPRRFEQARQETLVLEFIDGLSGRPIIRKASPEEQCKEGGTSIRVWLKSDEVLHDLLRTLGEGEECRLPEGCAHLCPILDVDLHVHVLRGDKEQVVRANDWIHINPIDLFKRISGRLFNNASPEFLERQAQLLDLIRDGNGNIVGRACIVSPFTNRLPGAVTVGGMLSSALYGILGVLKGKPQNASRNSAVPVVSINDLRAWAAQQVDLIRPLSLTNEEEQGIAQMVTVLGCDTKHLVVANSKFGRLTISQIPEMSWSDEVILVSSEAMTVFRQQCDVFKLGENVIEASLGYPAIVNSLNRDPIPAMRWLHSDSDTMPPDWYHLQHNLLGQVARALALSWSTSLSEVLSASVSHNAVGGCMRCVGYADGQPKETIVDIIRNPNNQLE